MTEKQIKINGQPFKFKASTKRERRGSNSMALLIKATPHGKFWQEEGQPELVKGSIRGVDFTFIYGKGHARFMGLTVFSWVQINQDIRAIEQDYQDDQFDPIDDY